MMLSSQAAKGSWKRTKILSGLAADALWQIPQCLVFFFLDEPTSSRFSSRSPRAKDVRIDAWGDLLHGCVRCNQWRRDDGAWQQLAEDDIAALRGLAWQRPDGEGGHC